MQHLINAVLRHPDAALNHLRSYGQLANAELNLATQVWQKRLLLTAGALVSGGLAVGFIGLLSMAWALVPGTLGAPLSPLQWLALCAPAVLSAAACLTCLLALRGTPAPTPLQHLTRQWQLDASWLLPTSTDNRDTP